ncbi:MAG: hypothetical protein ABSC08_06160 [Bryobacteraceae bacterium]|jgi:hypothetical protein
MGAVLSPIDIIDTASGVSPYASLHLPTTVLSRATPQDVAVLSVQAIQLGETDSLFGHSQANDPFATQTAIDSALSNTSPLPATASSGSTATTASEPSSAETPEQMLAGLQLQTVQALYGSQNQATSTFSVMA